jgi:hypothetical protein
VSRGKNAVGTTVRLRQQLADAADARKNLERRLAAAERERDQAKAWRVAVETEGLPAVSAERQRADAAVAERAAAVLAEREKWLSLVEAAQPFVRIMVLTGSKMPHPESAEFSAMVALGFGKSIAQALPGSSRQSHRNLMTKETLAKTARAQLVIDQIENAKASKLDLMRKKGVTV